MSKKIKIIALDDQHLIRQGIRRLLEQDPQMELVGEGWVGDHLSALVAEHRPDVVLLDVNMPLQEESDDPENTFRAFPAVARLHKAHPQTVIIILSQYISITLIEGAFEIGVRGYILKDDIESLNLTEAIHTVLEGRYFISEAIKEEFIRSRNGRLSDALTERQKEIVRQMASNLNLTYAAHAAALNIKEQSLRNQLTTIFGVLGAPSLASCIIKSMREGIVPFETRYVE